MRTLTAYGIAVVIVFLVLNAIVWFALKPTPPWAGSFRVFSIGFGLGMLGMYLASVIYGYHQ